MSDASNPGSSEQPTELEPSEVGLLQGDILEALGEPGNENDEDKTDEDVQRTAVSTQGCPGASNP